MLAQANTPGRELRTEIGPPSPPLEGGPTGPRWLPRGVGDRVLAGFSTIAAHVGERRDDVDGVSGASVGRPEQGYVAGEIGDADGGASRAQRGDADTLSLPPGREGACSLRPEARPIVLGPGA